MNEESILLLCEFITTNRFIECIDISWNNIRASYFRPLLEVLRDNRKLKFVNL